LTLGSDRDFERTIVHATQCAQGSDEPFAFASEGASDRRQKHLRIARSAVVEHGGQQSIHK
jgi:hypothetical protein